MTDIQDIESGTQTRVRAGINGFSPDKNSFACLYIPEDNQNTSYLQITNLDSGKVTYIDKLPSSCDYILEFNWINKNSLLIVTGEDVNGMTVEKTWTYNIKEDTN